MNGFFLTIGPERIKKTNPVKVKHLMGIMKDSAFIQPIRCEKCGGYIELGEDWEEGLVSCGDCGNECRVYHYPELPIRL